MTELPSLTLYPSDSSISSLFFLRVVRLYWSCIASGLRTPRDGSLGASFNSGPDPLNFNLNTVSSIGFDDFTTVVYDLPTCCKRRFNDLSIGSGFGFYSTAIFPVDSSIFPSNLAKFNYACSDIVMGAPFILRVKKNFPFFEFLSCI